MRRLFDVMELTKLFARGVNIMEILRGRQSEVDNSAMTILYSYDLQAGTYNGSLKNPEKRDLKRRQGEILAGILNELGVKSLLDAGTGEATTFASILKALRRPVSDVFAFDISLSRLLYGKKHLEAEGCPPVSLFTATLDTIPLPAASVDAVLTFHAIEPNAEERVPDILRELLRVMRRYLVLVEPSCELGGEKTRARIEKHRYVHGLPAALESLNARIVRHELFPALDNPENEAALIVAERLDTPAASNTPELVSPIGGGRLIPRSGYYLSPADGFAFPIIEGIPCLLLDNAILATRLGDLLEIPAR